MNEKGGNEDEEAENLSAILYFTSEDEISFSMMERIRAAWVEKIEKVNNAWNVVIYED